MAYRGLRKSTIRPTREEAREAEATILQALKAMVTQTEQDAARSGTLRELLGFYVADLEARGKSHDTIGRAAETAHVLERLMPNLLDRPVSRIGETELYAFRKARMNDSTIALRLRERATKLRDGGAKEKAEDLERKATLRAREGTKASTINRDLRTLRAMPKRAMPSFRFPVGVFFPEDEARVRWLRPRRSWFLRPASDRHSGRSPSSRL